MTNRPRRRRPEEPDLLDSGREWVLLASGAYSLPQDWIRGVVLWEGHGHVVVRQLGWGGQTGYVALWDAASVVARGSSDRIRGVQDAARDEVRALAATVKAAEEALDAARRAVQDRLREMVARGVIDAAPESRPDDEGRAYSDFLISEPQEPR